jgi:hypothetical protein
MLLILWDIINMSFFFYVITFLYTSILLKQNKKETNDKVFFNVKEKVEMKVKVDMKVKVEMKVKNNNIFVNGGKPY